MHAVVAGLLLAGLLAGDVLAGAWPQREGKVQIIWTTTRKIAPVSAYFGDPATSDKNASQIFVEYGATKDLTLGLTLFGEFSTTADEVEARIGLHARHLLWSGKGGDVISIQGGVSVPVERWLGSELGDNRPDSVTELDVRVLYGRGWQTDWGNSFVSTEAGIRLRGEGQDEELRVDATAGHEAWRGVMGLMSVFTSVPLGKGSDVSVKLAPSIAYTLWPWLGENDKKPIDPVNPNTVQLGVVWDASEPGDGLALTLSVWKGF